MRAIFFVLLMANALLLASHWLVGPTDAPPARSGPSLPSGAAELALLSERSDDTPASTPGPRVSEQRLADTAELGEGALCTLLGPFSASVDAEPLVQRLRSLDVDAEVRDLEVPDGRGYWVYLPPELSHRAALRRLHELQAKDIDSYVIPRGELANGISFGMFSRSELAQARQQEMLDQGYGAQIREIERTHRETWIMLPPGQARRLGDNLWQELLASVEGLERRQNFCPGVASE